MLRHSAPRSLQSWSASLMSHDLLQASVQEAAASRAMPHPEHTAPETRPKSACQRSVKRQATERSTTPSLVAVLPDELLLKVLQSCQLLPVILVNSAVHPNMHVVCGRLLPCIKATLKRLCMTSCSLCRFSASSQNWVSLPGLELTC